MVAVISGASSGIGAALAKMLHSQGYKVYGLSRSKVKSAYMTHLEVDVTERREVRKAVRKIYLKEENIDCLILCAGISLASPAERTSMKDARSIFDVNFWGAVHVINCVLPNMKKRRSGHIITVSSMTGLFPVPYLSYYSASKSALFTYTSALSGELKPYGVKISSILPGGVRTNLTHNRKKYSDNENPRLKRAVEILGTEEQTGLHPEEVAEAVLNLLKDPSPKTLVPVGKLYRFYTLLLRLLPYNVVLYFINKKYTGTLMLPSVKSLAHKQDR